MDAHDLSLGLLGEDGRAALARSGIQVVEAACLRHHYLRVGLVPLEGHIEAILLAAIHVAAKLYIGTFAKLLQSTKRNELVKLDRSFDLEQSVVVLLGLFGEAVQLLFYYFELLLFR